MSRRDTNFYYSFLVLTPDRRDAIMATWDFFRAVDDAVDDLGPCASGEAGAAREACAHERIAAWRRDLAACFAGGTPVAPQAQALVPHIRRFGLPEQAFVDVIDGVEMDISPRRWATIDDLRQYCLRVASAVGLVCLEIFGYRNAQCRQYAVDLGIALQLTNILRDVGKDLRDGRVYLPTEDLDRFGVTEEDLQAGRMTPAMRSMLEFQAQRAHEYFERARRGMPREDGRSLVAARIMGAIYETLLGRLERGGFPVFGEPLRLSRGTKARVALAVWLRAMLGA